MGNWILLPTATKSLDLLLILSAFSFFLFAIGSFIKWLKPSKASVGKGNVVLEFGKKKKKDDEDIDSEKEKGISLSACVEENPSFGNELLLVVSKSIRFGYDICQIKEVILTRAQMNMSQVKSDTIKNIFLREYTNKILELKSLNVPIQEFSYEVFREFIERIIRSQILDDLKRSYKENHLAYYAEEDYEENYCRDHIKRILSNMRLELQNMLPSNICPTIKDVLDIFDRYEQTFFSTLRETLYEARGIAIKYENEQKRKTERFDEEILTLVGIENASRSSK